MENFILVIFSYFSALPFSRLLQTADQTTLKDYDHDHLHRPALREMQELTASIVCPYLPLADEINDGTPLTIEHIHALTDTLSRIACHDVHKEIETALECAQDKYQAAPGDTDTSS